MFIEARGPPNIAKAKMAAAIAEVKKMLIPQASIPWIVPCQLIIACFLSHSGSSL